tara:strand:+ start:1550 stop:1930 length:381 start_codon:yes stop_codon:yes gene_type:complete
MKIYVLGYNYRDYEEYSNYIFCSHNKQLIFENKKYFEEKQDSNNPEEKYFVLEYEIQDKEVFKQWLKTLKKLKKLEIKNYLFFKINEKMVIEEMEYKTMNMEDYNNLKIHFSDNYTEFDEIDFFYE